MPITKVTNTLGIVVFLMLLVGCESTKQIENSFKESYLTNSVDLIFTSPNFSAFHAPPLMAGFAYIETFEKAEFCRGNETYIGKVTVTRANKTQYSKLPVGQIVANIGYHARGANGGGLIGNTYFGFVVEPGRDYKITVTESRPLVTSYSVEVGVYDKSEDVAPIPVLKGKRAICLDKATTL